MLYVLPSLASARRDCHGHCHVKSELIGGEGLWGYSGSGGGLGSPGPAPQLGSWVPPWGSGGRCQEEPFFRLGARRPEQSRLVSWTGLGRHPPAHPPTPTFSTPSPHLRLLTGPHPNAKNGGEPRACPGACGDSACLHCRSQPSSQTDKPSASPASEHSRLGAGRGGRGGAATERCLYCREEGSKKAKLLLQRRAQGRDRQACFAGAQKNGTSPFPSFFP